MLDSRSIANAVFGNLRFYCDFCGKKLDLIDLPTDLVHVKVPCYTSCGCEESKKAREQALKPRNYSDSGIPKLYLKVGADTDGYEYEVANGASLFVHGPNGNGKSTFAASLAKALIDMGISVRWENSRRFISEIQGMYDGRKTDALERAFACRVLVLDDLGKEQPTAFSISMLYELIESRYGDMKPIVATSNFDRAQLASRWASADAETASAIVSRLCDNCETIEMDGEDRRL